MKCSKCGEEFFGNVKYCPRCGELIDNDDIGLIEEQLANNVGELLDEIIEEENTKKLINKAHSVYDYKDELKVEEKYDTLKDFKPVQLDDDFEEELKRADIIKNDAVIPVNSNPGGFMVDSIAINKKSKRDKEAHRELQEKKLLRVKIIMAIVAIFVIILVAVVLIFVPDSTKRSNEFKNLYNDGMNYYNNGMYAEAVDAYRKAYDAAKDKSSVKKVLTSLWDAYEKIEGTDMQRIDVIKELIELEPDNIDYYEAILKIYDRNGMVGEIDALMKSVVGTDIAANLTAYSFMGPEFNYESGTYDQYLYITLTDDHGYDIYYTVDGSEPGTSSTKYTDTFEIANEGVTVVKAVSINEKGISSTVVTKEFDIKLSNLVPPEVTPDSGTYNAVSQIVINVPVGCTAYYTIGPEAEVPSESSIRYEGPIDMPTGKSVFSAIVVNEQGVASSMTQKIYELDVDRAYTYNQALDSLKTNLIASGFILDDEGNTASGYSIIFSYVSVQVIEGNEYYLIQASSGEVFGVGTVTGVIVSVTRNEKGVYQIVK